MKFIWVVMLVLSASILLAQKVNIENHDVNAIHHVLPVIGFENDVRSYGLVFEANFDSLKEIRVTEANLKERIVIQGYPQNNSLNGAKVILKLKGPEGEPFKLQSAFKKSKNGVSLKEYFYTVKFNCSMELYVQDVSGNVLYETVIIKDKEVNSMAYSSRVELRQRFNRIMFYTGHYKTLVTEIIEETNKILNRNFGYQQRTRNVGFKTLSTESHDDYGSWKLNEKVVERACKALNPFEVGEYTRMMMPAIDFWKSHAAGYNENDDDQKKLKSATLLNLSLAHMLADHLEFAEGYANMVVDLNIDSRRAKFILHEIASINAALMHLKRPTRYFKSFNP